MQARSLRSQRTHSALTYPIFHGQDARATIFRTPSEAGFKLFPLPVQKGEAGVSCIRWMAVVK